MHKTDKVAVICVIHDCVAELDGNPLIYQNEAAAMRSFKQQVNMPSDYMIFHAPRDFQLVKISEFCRDDNGNMQVALTTREMLLTGTAAVDMAMRDSYLSMAKQQAETKNAS